MRLLIAACLALGAATANAVPPEAMEPGREWRVGTITIRGNTVVKSSDITDAMLTKARPWYMSWQFWEKRPAFDPVVFRADVERVARVYRNTGYYHASATADVVLPAEGDVVDLTVDVDEGPPTYVRQLDVELRGATLPDGERDRLLASMPLKLDQVFDQAAYARSATLLHAYYREHGYARVKVDRKAVVDYRDDTATVTYQVESGPSCVFGTMHVVGTQKVEPDVVQAEVTWDPGEPFRQSDLDETQKNLTALKLFPNIRIVEEGGPTDAVVDTRIEVSEGPFHELQFGIGYDTEEQVRGIAAWRDYNFYGDARQLGFTVRGSFIYRTIAADFIQPHFPGSRDRFRLTLSEQQEDEDTFFNDRSRVSPRIEFRPSPIITPYVFYRFEYDNLSDVNQQIKNLRPSIAPGHGLLSGLGFGADVNTTDDPIDPHRGWTASLSVEPVGAFLGGDFDFIRLIGEVRRYQPLVWNFGLALRTRIGVEDPIAGSDTVPLFERFFAGGTNSVRGYERWHVGPMVGGDPIGGLSLIEMSIELRHPITETIGAAVFLDAGQVSVKKFDLPFDDLDYGTGFGVSYKTPIGPLRVDLGFPLERPPGDAGWQIHLSLGQAF
jgi:outer membrane protein assembly complex protein YaeT